MRRACNPLASAACRSLSSSACFAQDRSWDWASPLHVTVGEQLSRGKNAVPVAVLNYRCSNYHAQGDNRPLESRRPLCPPLVLLATPRWVPLPSPGGVWRLDSLAHSRVRTVLHCPCRSTGPGTVRPLELSRKQRRSPDRGTRRSAMREHFDIPPEISYICSFGKSPPWVCFSDLDQKPGVACDARVTHELVTCNARLKS